MVVKKTLTAITLSVGLAAAPMVAFAQSQAAKTGSGTVAGVTAGQDKEGGGLSAGTIAAGVAVAVAIGIAVAAASDNNSDTSTSTSTSSATSTN